MIINNNKMLVAYLNSTVSNVFKILPLYEEENVGVNTYVESLHFELSGLKNTIKIDCSSEYISLLSTLISINNEIYKSDSKKSVIKREVFKCINIIKNMIAKIEDSDSDG